MKAISEAMNSTLENVEKKKKNAQYKLQEVYHNLRNSATENKIGVPEEQQ